jgi:hypothetical protein
MTATELVKKRFALNASFSKIVFSAPPPQQEVAPPPEKPAAAPLPEIRVAEPVVTPLPSERLESYNSLAALLEERLAEFSAH